MQTNSARRLPTSRRIFFEETSKHTVDIKNAKCKENTAVINRTFAPDSSESLDKIIEKCIQAIDLSD